MYTMQLSFSDMLHGMSVFAAMNAINKYVPSQLLSSDIRLSALMELHKMQSSDIKFRILRELDIMPLPDRIRAITELATGQSSDKNSIFAKYKDIRMSEVFDMFKKCLQKQPMLEEERKNFSNKFSNKFGRRNPRIFWRYYNQGKLETHIEDFIREEQLKERMPEYLAKQAKELEPERESLKKINPELADDLFFLFNNLNIRHNNVAEGTTNYRKFVAKMGEDELCKWYSLIQEMVCYANHLLEKPVLQEPPPKFQQIYYDNKEKIKNLKRNIKRLK